MAPWHELVLTCNLRNDIPQQVIDVLNYFVSPSRETRRVLLPKHPFFEELGWESFFGNDTAYFPGDPCIKFIENPFEDEFKLTLRTLVRKGDDRIKLFLQWIAPYSVTEGFVGYTRCDETELSLDLVYFEEGVVYYKSIAFYNDPPTIETTRITKSDEG